MLNREEYFFDKEGRKHWLLTSKLPLRDEHGTITGLVGMGRDISEFKRRGEALRNSEERFRLISENVADFILLFRNDGECLYASPSLRMLGYDSDALVKVDIFSMIHAEDLNGVQTAIESVQQTLAHRAIEFRFRDRKEEWCDMEATISLLIDDEGARILTVMRDVSERKKHERSRNDLLNQLRVKNDEIEHALERLTQMQEGLVQSEKMASIGQLTAGIAHEINNPLAFVSSNLNRFAEYFKDTRSLLQHWQDFGTSLAERKDLEAKIVELHGLERQVDLGFIEHDFDELMKNTREGTTRIKRIVDQLRGFSHMATSGFVPADINQAIDETLAFVWNEVKYKAVIQKDYGTLPFVRCNIGELKQVFVNLLVNAAHAIPEKGNITIHTSANTTHACIKITDTGKGIPRENLTRIFDPFFTTKPVGKGTGLGLWIVSTIVQNHRGTITVESEQGKGTTFTLTLPIEEEEKK
jgi:PAS domain S-box-containing protein